MPTKAPGNPTRSSISGFVGAVVTDARGEHLGRVIKESPAWFLVEGAGQKTVVMNNEVGSVSRGRIRLRLAWAEMEIRKDRPQVSEVEGA
jgi:hypothetical protein